MAGETWIEQEVSPSGEISSRGGGAYTRSFLADRGRGIETARAHGFVEGSYSVLDGELYFLDRLRWHNYQGKYDWVDVIYVSQQGGGGGGVSPSRDGKPHKKGDEEWDGDATAVQKSLAAAMDEGMIESAVDIKFTGSTDTIVTFPVPRMTRRRWLKGVKKSLPLPSSGADAVKEFMEYFEEIGDKVGDKFVCESVGMSQDGTLLLVSSVYKYCGKYLVDANLVVSFK